MFMTFRNVRSAAFGVAVVTLIGLTALDRVFGVSSATWVNIATAAAVLSLAMGDAPLMRRVVMAIAMLLAFATIVSHGAGAQEVLEHAASGAAFLGAFFAVVGMLRMVSQHSLAMQRCGAMLVTRPNSQRYVALSLGSLLFSTVLNFGALSLLGGMAKRASDEHNVGAAVERDARNRRVLVALMRGFGAFLITSPTAFSFAIVLSLVPEVPWWRILPFSLLAAMVFLAVGWFFDSITSSGAETPSAGISRPRGNIRTVGVPIAVLGLSVLGAAIIEFTFNTTLPEAVLIAVPLVAGGWAIAQPEGGVRRRLRKSARRARQMLSCEFYAIRGEIAFVMLLALVSSMLASLADAHIPAGELLGPGVPAWVAVPAIMFATVLAGQVGINPLITIAVLGNLLASPAAMGLTPVSFAMTLLVSWSLAGGTSGTVASVHIVATLAHKSITTITHKWNGPFTLGVATVLCILILAVNCLGY